MSRRKDPVDVALDVASGRIENGQLERAIACLRAALVDQRPTESLVASRSDAIAERCGELANLARRVGRLMAVTGATWDNYMAADPVPGRWAAAGAAGLRLAPLASIALSGWSTTMMTGAYIIGRMVRYPALIAMAIQLATVWLRHRPKLSAADRRRNHMELLALELEGVSPAPSASEAASNAAASHYAVTRRAENEPDREFVAVASESKARLDTIRRCPGEPGAAGWPQYTSATLGRMRMAREIYRAQAPHSSGRIHGLDGAPSSALAATLRARGDPLSVGAAEMCALFLQQKDVQQPPEAERSMRALWQFLVDNGFPAKAPRVPFGTRHGGSGEAGAGAVGPIARRVPGSKNTGPGNPEIPPK